MPFALGIDIGGTFTKIVALAADRSVLAEGRVPTLSADGPPPLVARAADAARKMCADLGLALGAAAAGTGATAAAGAAARAGAAAGVGAAARVGAAAGVGVGVAGLVDRATGVLVACPNLPGWEGFHGAEAFSTALGIPAVVENDASVAALAEATLGAGRGRDPVALLTLGTGVGGGLVIGGRIVHGRRGFAGEFGHMALTVDGGPRCACGARGCVEAFLRSSHVVARALELAANLPDPPTPVLARALASGEATARSVGEAARQGDPVALAVFTELGRHLGMAIANVISALNPEAVIVGGGVALAGDVLIDTARTTALARVMPPLAEDVVILPAELGDRGGMLGAALLALGERPTGS